MATGLVRKIKLQLDQAARNELRESFKLAAKDSVDALKSVFAQHMGGLKVDLAKGLIDKDQFKAKADEAARAFNEGILSRMKELGAAGKLSAEEYRKLADQLKKVGDEGGKSVGLLEQGWAKLKGVVLGLGATIAAAFTVRAIIDFGKESVKAAMESEKGWSTLSLALKNVGTDMGAAKVQIDAAIASITNKSAFDDDAVVQGLERLVTLTGDYRLSLAALPAVMQLASARQIPFAEAANIVGKALDGNTGALEKEMGALNQTRPILEQITAKFKGFAENEAKSFGGGLTVINNLWGDFQKAIGRAVIEGASGTNMFTTLSNAIKGGIQWVTEHRRELAALVDFAIRFGVEGFKRFGSTIAELGAIFSAISLSASNFGHAVGESWSRMVATVAGLIAGLLTHVQTFVNNAADVIAKLPFGEVFATKLREAAASMTGAIATVETFAHTKRVESEAHTLAIQENLRKSVDATTANVQTGAKAMGDAIDTETGRGVDGARGHLDRMPPKFQEIISAIGSDSEAFWTVDLPAQVDEANKHIDDVTRSTMADLDKYLRDQSAARTKEILGDREAALIEETQAQRDAQRKQLEEELLRLKLTLASANATEKDKRKAFDRTSAIYQELQSLDARDTLAKSDQMRKGRKEDEADVTKDAKAKSDERKSKVEEEIASHLGGLTSVRDTITREWAPAIMDVVGKLGLTDTAVGGIIAKAVSVAGAIGGWIDNLGKVIDLAGDVVDFFGDIFHAGGVVGGRPGAGGGGGDYGPDDGDWWDPNSPDWWGHDFGGGPLQGPRGGGFPRGFHDGGTVPSYHQGGRIKPNERLILAEAGEIILPNKALGSLRTAISALTGFWMRRNGQVAAATKPSGALVDDPAAPWGTVPRFHTGGWLGWGERPIIGRVRDPTFSQDLAGRLARSGDSHVTNNSSRAVNFHAGAVVIHAGAGTNGTQIGRDFIREVNRELGGRLSSESTKRGNATR